MRKFISPREAIRRFYKNDEGAFYNAVKDGSESLYVGVRAGSVHSLLSTFLEPYRIVPDFLIKPVLHRDIGFLRIPQEKVGDLLCNGLCFCEIFEEALTVNASGQHRKLRLRDATQIPGEFEAEVLGDYLPTSVRNQINKGGIYEVKSFHRLASDDDGKGKLGPDVFDVELAHEQSMCWGLDAIEERNHDPFGTAYAARAVQRSGIKLLPYFMYRFGVYDDLEPWAIRCTFGIRLRKPKSIRISLDKVLVLNRESERKTADLPTPPIDENRVELRLRTLLQEYEVENKFEKSYFSTRLYTFLRIAISQWEASPVGGRPKGTKLKEAFVVSGAGFVKEHIRFLAALAGNEYPKPDSQSKRPRLKKRYEEDPVWSRSAIPTLLGLWREHVATLGNVNAPDANDWGNRVKRALKATDIPEDYWPAVCALIAADGTEASDKFNGIKRL